MKDRAAHPHQVFTGVPPLPSSPTSVPAPPPERPGASCSQAKVQGWIKHFFYSPKPRQPRKNLIYPRSYLSIHILRFSYNTSLKQKRDSNKTSFRFKDISSIRFEFEFQLAFLKESSFIKGIKVSFIVKTFIGKQRLL